MGALLMVAGIVAMYIAAALRQSVLDRRVHVRRVTRMAQLSAEQLSGLASLPGRAAVRGFTVPGPRGLVRAPLSNMDCLWYRVERTGPAPTRVETDGCPEISLGGRVFVTADLAAHPLVPGAPTLTQTTVSEYAGPVHVRERIVPVGLAVLAVGRPARRDIGVVLEPAVGAGTTALTDRELLEVAERAADRRARLVTPLILGALALFSLGLAVAVP